MNQTLDWRIMLLTKGIESQSRMIWHQRSLQRNKLATNRILEWIVPVDHGKGVWCNTNSHGSNMDSLFDFIDELIASLDVREW